MIRSLEVPLLPLLVFGFALTAVAIGAFTLIEKQADYVLAGPRLAEKFDSVERRWILALEHNDLALFERSISDSFVGTIDNQVLSKPAFVNFLSRSSGPVWKGANVEQLEARSRSDTAVVIGEMTFGPGGRAPYRFTKLYVFENGDWRLLSAHYAHE